MICFSLKIKT